MAEVTKTVDPKIAAKDINGDGHISLEEYELDMEFASASSNSLRLNSISNSYFFRGI